MRAALNVTDRVPDLRDHDSLSSFCNLVEEVTGPNEHTARLHTLIREEDNEGVGVT
ncbi:hypothetical protein [Streptomyces sp. NPDC001401]|uniref:hypothetical protein n=1 Tax=Streptomyces sp. NPDC001401 TaxID=3364570 RepID=UPI0036C84F6A